MRNLQKVFSVFILVLIVMASFQLFSVTAADIKTAPVREGDKYLGREFNQDFDKLYDIFERATIEGVAGTGLWWASTDGTDVRLTEREKHLEANYSTTIGTTKGAPIYKVASPANTDGAYPFLVFVMKGKNGASINDLYISFRYDDNHEDIDVNFTDLFDPDLYPLPEFIDQYQVYIIDLASSLNGKEFISKDGTGNIQAGCALAGFHLMSRTDGDGAGTVVIKEVYWSKDATTLGYVEDNNNALLDDFNRTDLSDTTGTSIWWRGGSPESKIIGKHLVFDYTNKKAIYRSAGYDNSNAHGIYENFVLRIRGTEGGEDLKISPFYVKEDGTEIYGEPVALSSLKGPDNQPVPALTKDFQNIVINFAANGWDKKVNGFKFESIDGKSGLVYIDKIFFTNLEYDASSVLTEYPILDLDDIVVFDDFERETVGATAEYDPNNPVALENDLFFIIAYAGMDRMSIDNGALVLDCTQNSDYIQYTSAGVNNNDGSYQYVVFKVKGEEGATLENFRIKTIDASDARSSDVWGNGGLKSGTGLPIPDFGAENYPYITDDGYMYVIVDLAASNLTETVNGFDIFYSGTGKLYIDAIFFANPGVPVLDMDNALIFDDFERDVLVPEDLNSINKWYVEGAKATIEDGSVVLDATDKAHAYYKAGGYPNNYDEPKEYLVLTMKGAEGTTLESFRINTITDKGDSAERFANQGHLVSFPGVPIPELTTEYQTYIIDLEASGLPANAQGLTITFGDWAAGKLYIDDISFADRVDLTSLLNKYLQQ